MPDRHGLATDGSNAVKVQISSDRCQGHGRCYDLAPDLFGEDDEGYGMVLGDGVVPPGREREARLAVANCPERAVELLEEA
jgi:ferredoxin